MSTTVSPVIAPLRAFRPRHRAVRRHRRLAALAAVALVATSVPLVAATTASAQEVCLGLRRAYVANSGDGTVTVIDTTDVPPLADCVETIDLKTVDAGKPTVSGVAPFGVVASPNGDRVYATHGAGNLVSVIETKTNTVAATVEVGDPGDRMVLTEAAISPDGAHLYVVATPDAGSSGRGRVYPIDTTKIGAPGAVGDPVPVGRAPGGVAVAHDPDEPEKERFVYVTNTAEGTVSVFDVSDGTLRPADPDADGDNTIDVGNAPTAVAANPTRNEVYVVNTGGETVQQRVERGGTAAAATSSISVIDTSTDSPPPPKTWVPPLLVNPGSLSMTSHAGAIFTGVATSPDGKVYAVATAAPFYPVPFVEGLGNTAFGDPRYHNGRVYRINPSDSDPLASASAVTVGIAPTGVAVSPDNTWVYVTNTAEGTVSVRDTKTFSEKGPVPVGPAPTGVAGISFPPELPAITTQPANRTVTVGQSATFSVKATGTQPLSYQWRQRDGSGDMEDIPGATGVSHTIEKTTMAHHGAVFDVVVRNGAGPVPSRRATLTVTASPVILTQPEDKLVTTGEEATFEVEVAGLAPLSYQWRRNGTVIDGATGASYTAPPATRADDGSAFDVVVRNGVGSVVSRRVVLNVDFAPVPPSLDPDAPGFHRLGTLWAGFEDQPQRLKTLNADTVTGIGLAKAKHRWTCGDGGNTWNVYDLQKLQLTGVACTSGANVDSITKVGFQTQPGVGGRAFWPEQWFTGRAERQLCGPDAGSKGTGGLAYEIEGEGESRTVSVGVTRSTTAPLFSRPCPRVGGAPVDYEAVALASYQGRSARDELVTLEVELAGAVARSNTNCEPGGSVGPGIGNKPTCFLFVSPLATAYTDMWRRAHESVLVRSLNIPRPDDADKPLLVPDSEHPGKMKANEGVDAEIRWEVDLTALCSSWLGPEGGASDWVARTDDAVLTHCWDERPPGKTIERPGLSTKAPQGYLIKIPLDEDGFPIPRPGTGDALVFEPGSGDLTVPPTTVTTGPPAVRSSDVRVLNATIRRIPTLPGPLSPIADPTSGRVFLLTADSANGAAVWVMDPDQERFIGVATSGRPWSEVEAFNQKHAGQGHRSAVGFNATLGRAYVLSPEGILVVDGRIDPLGGVPYPALDPCEDNDPCELVSPGIGGPVLRDLATWSISGRHYVAVPVVGKGYVVFEDKVPVPEPGVPLDPDRLTTQVEEREGETLSTLSGASEAAGVHVVVAGGVTKTANTADPGCRGIEKFDEGGEFNFMSPFVNPFIRALYFEPRIFDGECLADVLFAQGHREAYLGSSQVESGTAGVAASAQGMRVPSSDTATNADLRAAGECMSGRSRRGTTGAFDYIAHAPEGAGGRAQQMGEELGKSTNPFAVIVDQLAKEGWDWVPEDEKDRNSNRKGFDFDEDNKDDFPFGPAHLFEGLFGGHAQACGGVSERVLAGAGLDTSGGTNGEAGEGFPARADCTDYGTGRSSKEAGGERFADFSSSVTCDGAVPQGKAESSTSGFVLPSTEDPEVMVGSATSAIESHRVVEGGKAYQVTDASAMAEGIRIGPVAMGAVRTTSVVRAGGRTGTAGATLTREWCDVTVGAEVLSQGCSVVTGPEDPLVARVADEVSLVYPKLRISVPEASVRATPGGYQGVVIKDGGLRASDSSVNDDDSIVVPALQVVFLNDGAEGRNRWVVQLAGVETEARYAINVLPTFSGFSGSSSSFMSTKATPSTRRVVPGRKSLPRASTIIEGESFDTLLTGGTAAPQNPAQRFVTWVPNALKDLLRLLIQHPLEFALLFLVFSLLATPPYLAYRRRTALSVLSGTLR